MIKKQIISLLVVIALLAGSIVGYLAIKKHNEENETDNEIKDEIYSVLSFNADKATKLTYSYNNVTYVLEKVDSSWVYLEDDTLNIDQTSVTSLINAVSNVTSAVKIDNVTDFEQYGLEKPVNKVVINTSEGNVEFSVGNCNSSTGEYYFRVGQEKTVYMVNSIIGTKFNVEIKDLCFTVTEEPSTE